MAKENSVIVRIPKKIYEDMDKALQDRFRNNLISRKDLKFIEGLRLWSRTDGYQQSLKELRFKPKRENLKKK